MVDEREEWLTRRFDILDDVDVPALWDVIVARADTEPNVEYLTPRRRRRWVPVAAAAAIVALVAAGLLLWVRDDPAQVDTPPAGGNTVQIVEGDGNRASVTPTAVAGIVSFEISNPTDENRNVVIFRTLPGATSEDVSAGVEEFARTGSTDEPAIEEQPLLGVANGPADRFTTAMPLDAGTYAVSLGMFDERFEIVPGHVPQVRMLTVVDGAAGAAPTPTLRFNRMDGDYLTGPTTAPSGAATVHVENTAGGPYQLALIELAPGVDRQEYELWGRAIPEGGLADWSTSPATAYRFFIIGAEQQTVTIDLAGGDLRVEAPTSFEEGGAFSSVWVNVE